MAVYDDIYRVINTITATVASAGGAANSITTVQAQTYAVEMMVPGMAGSVGGAVRYAIGAAPVASSTTSPLMPVNELVRRKVTPGEKISFISNDAGTGTVTVMELTK